MADGKRMMSSQEDRAVFTDVDQLYSELRELRSLKGFSQQWHTKFEDIVARVPFPPRSFGGAEATITVALPLSDPPPTAADQQSGSAGAIVERCATCKAELPPPPRRQQCHACCVAAAAADAQVDPWPHDRSDPAVYRTRVEYMARCAHLEAEVAALKQRQGPTTTSPARGNDTTASAAAAATSGSPSDLDESDSVGDGSGEGGAPRSSLRKRTPSLQMVESLAHSIVSPPRSAAKRIRQSGPSPTGRSTDKTTT